MPIVDPFILSLVNDEFKVILRKIDSPFISKKILKFLKMTVPFLKNFITVDTKLEDEDYGINGNFNNYFGKSFDILELLI